MSTNENIPVEGADVYTDATDRSIAGHTRTCDQCDALMIQGVFCHEAGCPNMRKRWIEEEEQWVLFLKCFECRLEVRNGDSCCADEYEAELDQAHMEHDLEDEEEGLDEPELVTPYYNVGGDMKVRS